MPIVIAGSKTTATALAGTMNYLVQTPVKLARLTKEIRDTFQSDGDIDPDAVRDLPYLNACLNEGLRMCPPVSYMLPKIVPAGGVNVAGVFLPGGASPNPLASMFQYATTPTSPHHITSHAALTLTSFLDRGIHPSLDLKPF